MKVSKLDGFQRVETQTPPQHLNGVFGMTKKRLKRIARKQNPGGGGQMSQDQMLSVKQTLARPYSDNCKVPATKRQKAAQRRARMNGDTLADEGVNSAIGFSRVFAGDAPTGANMQGFGRIRYTNKQLQGLSLQGLEILQGYGMGDTEDFEDWDYLLSIEHPDTLQGFPSWVLQGKAQRKARQAARKADKATKKQAKTTQTAAKDDRRQRKKEVKTAKKEEKLRKKVARGDSRTLRKTEKVARKQQRLDDKKLAKRQKEETKRIKAIEKAKSKAARAGKRSDLFERVSDTALPLVADLVSGRGDFEDYTSGDFMPTDFGGGLNEFIQDQRGMSSEGALRNRDQVLEFMDEVPEDDFVLDDEDDDGGKSSMMIPLAIAAGLGLVMMNKGKNKKK